LTGVKTRLGNRMGYNRHMAPSTSDFCPIKEEKVKDEDENDDNADPITLGEFDGIEGGPSKVKKLEAEEYESSEDDSAASDGGENAEDGENGAEKT